MVAILKKRIGTISQRMDATGVAFGLSFLVGGILYVATYPAIASPKGSVKGGIFFAAIGAAILTYSIVPLL